MTNRRSPADQRLKGLMKRILRKLGVRLVRLNTRQIVPSDIMDPECYGLPQDESLMYRPWLSPIYDRWITPPVMANTMLSRQKLYYLVVLLQQVRRIVGDVLDAGCGSGGSSLLLVNVLRAMEPGRRFWALDSFDGYQGVDVVRDGSHCRKGDMKGKDDLYVRALLQNPDVDVRVVKGGIPGSLSCVETDAVAFAHIDVNLYEPTLAATEFCLSRMPPGGIIVFDDFNWPATYGARRAIDSAVTAAGQQVVCLAETSQAFLIRQ